VTPERVLQTGFGRHVVLAEGGHVVRKTFHAGTEEQRRRLATDEYSRLQVFWAALDQIPEVTCPQPLGMVEKPAPGFDMAWVEGTKLIDHLAAERLPDGDLVALAARIATALRVYVETVKEPYSDLKLDNVLLVASGSLAFLDLGVPQDAAPPADDESPYESSVGNLLASLVFESARPKRFLRRRLHQQSVRVAAALVSTLLEGGVRLRTGPLLAAARRAYLRSTFDRGGVVRTAWYATVGWVAGRRVGLPGACFGPVATWDR
jgi:hypothetical protein